MTDSRGSNSGGNGAGSWFNDRRFTFATSADRIRQNLNQLLAEVSQSARQNPELIGQLRHQLQTLTDLVNSTQQQNRGASQPNGAPGPFVQIPQASLQNAGRAPVRQFSLDVQPNNAAAAATDALTPSTSRQRDVILDLEVERNEGYRFGDLSQEISVDEEETADQSLVQPPDPVPNDQMGGQNNVQDNPGDSNENNDNDDWQRVLELLQTPDMQRIVKLVLSILPFFLIVFLKLILDHWSYLLTVSLFILLFCYANKIMVRFVSARLDGKMFDCVKIVVLVTSGISNLYWFFKGEKLWLSLVFHPTPALDHGDHVDLCLVLWTVLAADFVGKFFGLILKAVVGFLSNKVVGIKRKRNLYQWIEYSIQLYRCALPIVPWWYYIMSTHSDHGIVIGLSFTLLLFYLAVKAAQFWSKLCVWKASSMCLFQKYSYGTRPSSKDLLNAGSTCSICYGDYRDAVKLSCKHIFCEDCISIWFDKEKTCPMCRAAVSQEDTTWKCGSTSWMVQLF